MKLLTESNVTCGEGIVVLHLYELTRRDGDVVSLYGKTRQQQFQRRTTSDRVTARNFRTANRSQPEISGLRMCHSQKEVQHKHHRHVEFNWICLIRENFGGKDFLGQNFQRRKFSAESQFSALLSAKFCPIRCFKMLSSTLEPHSCKVIDWREKKIF